MRQFSTRFLTLVSLFFLSLPVGLSFIGCTSHPGNYCNGAGYGQKIDAIANINLEPKATGVSLAYGQTLNTPFRATATNCKGASVSVGGYSYGTTSPLSNMNFADLDPAGNLCAGSWNRNSPGGIQNYTICTPPAAPGVAYITASAGGVTSNTVPVFIHPSIRNITIPTQTACVSQSHTLPQALSALTTVTDTNGNRINNGYDANGNPDPAHPNVVGTITYSAIDPTIVTIDNTVLPNAQGVNSNGTATAHSPGSTTVTATLAGTSSTAGYFYTCPPASISLAYADGSTTKNVTVGIPQNLVATVKDVNNVTLSGLSLDFTSTNPTNIAVGSAGVVTATFPGAAAVTAICQPTTCNPAPINQIGQLGTGKPIVSNSVQATTKGRVSTYVWVSSPQTQNFVQLDLSVGGVGALVKLPYFPNSMVLSQDGSSLYFGSFRELMVYAAVGNTLRKEDINVPGVVLAVSPDNSTTVINDPIRQVFYLYANSSGTYASFAGLGTKAQFTPDSKTLYIAGTDPLTGLGKLYVHNAYTGWSTYDITGGATDVAITVPSVAAYLAGQPTSANGFCPNTAVSPNAATAQYYPNADGLPLKTDRLAATNDGLHILGATASIQGATLSTGTLTDIAFSVLPGVPTGSCPATGINLTSSRTFKQIALTGVTPAAIDQVVASPDSSIAFVTYCTTTSPSCTSPSTAPSNLLPYYKPSGTAATAATLGVEGNVTLSGGATAPLVGIFSPDNTIFFVGTAGDNLLHFINLVAPVKPTDPTVLTDTQTVDPKLIGADGVTHVPPQFLAVHPRPTT